MSDLIKKSAAELAKLIADGEVSSREVTQAHLDQISKTDSIIHAFLHVDGEGALDGVETLRELLVGPAQRRLRFDHSDFGGSGEHGYLLRRGTVGPRPGVGPLRPDDARSLRPRPGDLLVRARGALGDRRERLSDHPADSRRT